MRSGTVVVTNIISGTENQVSIPRTLDTDLVLAVFHTHGFQTFPSGRLSDVTNGFRSDVSSSLNGNNLTYVFGQIGLTLFNPNNPKKW